MLSRRSAAAEQPEVSSLPTDSEMDVDTLSNASEEESSSQIRSPSASLHVPPPSLFLSTTYAAVEQRKWEDDIRWDDGTDGKQSEEEASRNAQASVGEKGGFASLAFLALQPPSRPKPPPAVAAAASAASKEAERVTTGAFTRVVNSTHAPPSAADLAAKFTYLPQSSGGPGGAGGEPGEKGKGIGVSTWTEIGPAPEPKLVTSATVPTGNTNPAPQPSASPAPASSPNRPVSPIQYPMGSPNAAVVAAAIPAASPTAAFAAAVPSFYPVGPTAASVHPAFMGLTGHSAATAASFMANLSYGMNPAALAMMGGMGGYQSQQMMMAMAIQQQQLEQQRQTQLLAEQHERARAEREARRLAEIEAMKPAVRVPIKFKLTSRASSKPAAAKDSTLKPLPSAFEEAALPLGEVKKLPLKPRKDPTRKPAFPMKHVPIPPSREEEKYWGTQPPVVASSSVVAAAPAQNLLQASTAVSIDKYINREFNSMAWLNDVLWSDYASLNDAAYYSTFHPSESLPPLLPLPPSSAHTKLIWDANDPQMVFETAEQIDLARKKEAARAAARKMEEDRKQKLLEEKTDGGAQENQAELERKAEEEKANGGVAGNRFNISQDQYYDQDQAFTSHARTERVRLPHAAFAADLRLGPEQDGVYDSGEVVCWYDVRSGSDLVPVFVPLYPRNWSHDLWFYADEGQLAMHRPRLPREMIKLMLQNQVKAKLIPDARLTKEAWLDTVSERFHLTDASRRDQKIQPGFDDMSMLDGGLVLMEYLEQHPLMSMNIGMASRIVTYYRKTSDVDEKQINVEDGDTMILAKSDASSPFLGEIKPGMQVTALNNNLFIAPINRHPVPASLAQADSSIKRDMYCTFLLVRVGKRWHIRNIPTPYTVGQIEPKKQIPSPESPAAVALHASHIKFVAMRAFFEKKEVKVSELVQEFTGHAKDPDMAVFVRATLKELGASHAHQNSNVWYWPASKDMPPLERIRRIFTPEDHCLYQGMLAAQWRLRTMGISHFTSPRLVSELLGHIKFEHLIRVARFIEKQLELTPWYLSKGFISCTIEEKGMLMLEGRGNPLADGSGYSYLVVDKKKREEEMPEVKKKTGTDADLRRLTSENLENALLRFGMSPSEIKPMHRWERVRAVARFSTEASLEGKFETMRRFQRHVRQTMQGQMAEFKRAVNKIFEKQLQTIASSIRPDYTHEVDDDPAATATKRQETDEQKQYQEFMALQNASTNPNEAKKPGAKKLAGDATGGSDAAASKKKTRLVKKKLIRHAIVEFQPNGEIIRRTRNIKDPQLIEYWEADQRDGGVRLKMALGLLSGDEIAELRDSGQPIIAAWPRQYLQDNAYETRLDEEEAERSQPVKEKKAFGGFGGGRSKAPGGARAAYIERAERGGGDHAERAERTGGRGARRDGKGGRKSGAFGRGRGRAARDASDDDDDYGGDETDEDDEIPSGKKGRWGGADSEEDEEEEDRPPELAPLGLEDKAEWISTRQMWLIRCGGCGGLGHSRANLECPRAPKEKTLVEDNPWYEEAAPIGRGGGGARNARATREEEEEEEDDAVAKGLLAQGADGRSIKVNRKGISQVPQTAPRALPPTAPAGRGAKRFRTEDGGSYQQSSKRVATARTSKRGDAKVSLNTALQSIIDYCMGFGKLVEYFTSPVDTNVYHDYTAVLAKAGLVPIDLRTMRRKAYESKEQFEKDAEGLYKNSLCYNGDVTLQKPAAMVTCCAQEVWIVIQQQLQKPANAQRIAEAEQHYQIQRITESLKRCVLELYRVPSAKEVFGQIPVGVEGYLDKIREPMSLLLLEHRLGAQAYENPGQFVYDLQLLEKNAATWNGAEHPYVLQARQLIARAMEVLDDFFTKDEVVPREHDIPPPDLKASIPRAGTGGGRGATGPRNTGPRLTTPRLTTPRRGTTPERKKTPTRQKTPLASPAMLGGFTGPGAMIPMAAAAKGSLGIPRNAASMGRLHSPTQLESFSPARMEMRAPTGGAAGKGAAPASAPRARTPSPDPMQMFDSLMTDVPMSQEAGGGGDLFSMMDTDTAGGGAADGLTMDFGEAGMGLGLDALPEDV